MNDMTVTLDEETAAWARDYAAEHNMSLSQFLNGILHKTMCESRQYQDSMRLYFSKKAMNLSDGKPYPKREELYDRKILRRY